MSLDVFQQVFALSLASNEVRKFKGSQTALQKELQCRLAKTLPEIGAEWEIVWGPVVWKQDPDNAQTGPENSWFVAFHPHLQFDDKSVHPAYVIAIAGTPRESSFVWFFENFAVNTVADFNAWVKGGIQNKPKVVISKGVQKGGVYLATGTADATHVLLTTESPEGAASPGKTLLGFITDVEKSPSQRFISTGHSLGGALSPTLALALVKAGVISGINALTYPTAGASPGNIEFTALSEKTLPPRKQPGSASYQGWNLNLVNTLDIVPQAWAPSASISAKQNLLNIPTIYGKPSLPEVQAFVFVALQRSKSSGVLYKPLRSQYFTGPSPPTTPTSLKEFTGIASMQHVALYIQEVGIPVSESEEPCDPDAGLSEKTEEEKLYDYPLINDLQWALEHPEEIRQIEEGMKGDTEAQAYLEDAD